ncbi:MAG: hypothetical protein BWY80_00186 [Firmicutes bacterium ADurb.Bin456]|nr:MAG: hypothetical protein BWY80_00186 [Firmicutes bacterium ADurb.Bin456]
MKLPVIAPGESGALCFEQLTEARLDEVQELCDRCVGKNLYPRAYLASVIHKPDHYFYLLVTPERKAVAYIYFFLTGLAEMAALARLPRERLAVISPKENPVIGNLQSVGVAEAHRHRHLSVKLVRFYLERLQNKADTAFGVFWKTGGYVPMEKALKASGFLYLADAHRVWYGRRDLICPFCRGRCRCDAAIYYKPVRRRP